MRRPAHARPSERRWWLCSPDAFGQAIEHRRGLVLAVSLSLALAACAPERLARPNLLLVTLDTTRADHVSAYGYSRDTTPVLRALAAAGTRFAQAYAPTATTAPSHATLFTSLYPLAHGIVRNGLVLRDLERTLAEVLRDHGYATAAFVSSFVLDARFGWAQGFDLYDDDFDPDSTSMQPRDGWEEWKKETAAGGFDRRADETTRRAVAWLEGHAGSDRPFFLFVHYFDPHAPMVPPARLAARFAPATGAPRLDVRVGRYDAEIAFVDEQIGLLLEALARAGLEAETLVALTADHGEGLMQHGKMFHGVHLYEEAVRVPLILRWPGRVPEARVVEEPVGLVDLAPTLLALLGIGEVPPSLHGKSLAAALTDGLPLDPQPSIYLQRRHYEGERVGGEWIEGELFGIRRGRWKYIESGDASHRELYDLSADPAETRDLAAHRPDAVRHLSAAIAAWKLASRREGEAPRELGEPERLGLEALGYVE